MGTPSIRRATEDDAAAVSAVVPGLVPQASDDHHATFVIDGPAGPIAVLDLRQDKRHLDLLHLAAPDLDHARALHDFAEAAARALKARRICLAPRAMPDALSEALGYRNGVRKIASGAVPLWRDGTAALSQSLYYRGVWASLALLTGLGSVSLAVFNAGTLTLAHIVVPALLCIAGALFAAWQIGLVVQAARRSAGPRIAALATTVAATAIIVMGLAIHGRAVPALRELWEIRAGDRALGALRVTLSADGGVLSVAGAYGTHSEEAVRAALERNASVREVVLEGPGGRGSVGFALFDMFRARKLATRVETGCASACTIAFLGGVQRTLSPSGRLGFHRASFPGMDDNDMYESNRGMRYFLIQRAGVTPDFARKAIDTPAESIWVPTRAELLAGKVITR